MSSSSVNAHLDQIIVRRSTWRNRNSLQPQISLLTASPSMFLRFPQRCRRSCRPHKRGDNFSVCTLNLDHVVQLQQHANFRAAYRRARFVTADGFPIVVLSRLMGIPNRTNDRRRSRRTGLRGSAKESISRSFCLGANDLTLQMTARRLSERFKGLQIAGCLAPGPGFDPYSEEADRCDRKHSRLGRQTLLRRPGRATAGTVRGALPRRAEWNRHVVHRRRARFHRRHANPRAVHRTQKPASNGHGACCASRGGSGPAMSRCMSVVPRLVARTIPQIVQARMRKAA